MKVVHVVGARPNFMKVAPIMGAMAESGRFQQCLVHTGQHYDANLSRVFFEELRLPKPDIELNVGSGSHAEQTGRIMIELEPVLRATSPDLVLVVGDVNSTMATTITAAKLGIKVAHVEAGLRSFDRSMPEEINRVVTDALSDLLFTSERSGNENLRREGVPSDKIFFVGNVMIDTLLKFRDQAAQSTILDQLGLTPTGYLVLTLHRPSNVDDPERFQNLLRALYRVATDIPVVFPCHPRTQKQLQVFGVDLNALPRAGIQLIPPLGYRDFIALMSQAKLVLTDSGGVQEETTILGVPCLTLRDNTERPETLRTGTNTLVGGSTEQIVTEVSRILAGRGKKGQIPELWDGKAAVRIVEVLERV